MLKAYKYRLLPNEEQKKQLSQFFGSCRFVYNLGLETKIAAWASARKYISFFDLAKQMKELKDNECPWLKDVPAQGLQYSLRNLDNAYTAFFRKNSDFPKFKNRYSKQSVQFPQNVYINGDKIFIPKLKLVDFIQHRPLGKGEIKTATVSRTPANNYFVSILIDNSKDLPKKKTIKPKTAVGIDVGIKTFATVSTGATFENHRYLQHQLKRLRIELRKLKRRHKKGAKEQSKGYYKQKMIVAKLHEKISNQRNDFLHKASTSIVKKFDTVCMEDLNVSGMIQNHKLARSIADVSWSEFNRMLQYKAEWNGKNLIYIGRFAPSSKICSNCGSIFKELQLSDRVWICKKCDTEHNRDENAAINIKNFGLKTILP